MFKHAFYKRCMFGIAAEITLRRQENPYGQKACGSYRRGQIIVDNMLINYN